MVDSIPSPTAASDDPAPRYRAGAVARMARMPVATLRIWERRYRLSGTSAGGVSSHRLYSAAAVQRIVLLRQLTEAGHAIGTLVSLDAGQLRQVATTHAGAIARAPSGADLPGPGRLVVVGAALACRLRQQPLVRRLPRPLRLDGPFGTVAHAVEAAAGERCDVLLVQAAGLHEQSLAELTAAAAALGACRLGVLYGFASAAALGAYAAAGVALLREPHADAALGDFLRTLLDEATGRRTPPAAGSPQPADAAALVDGAVPPRRYDDATLVGFARLSNTISCECPRHVADLLMQLSRFETYSAECERLCPEDAVLHAHLRQTSAVARHLFENALERLMVHEGLLPRG